MTSVDWRLPENRREAFQRFYAFHLRYKTHPGCVYALLPAIAGAYDLDDNQRAWLVWINGNTQNVVTSLLLGEASLWNPRYWKRAVGFWKDNYKKLEWDADRRHQKPRFGEATEKWSRAYGDDPAAYWYAASTVAGWDSTWGFAKSQPFMGRLSAWSMIEYARILLGPEIPDAGSWLLDDVSGSKSHRNGLALVKGYDSTYWEAEAASLLGIVEELEEFADDLLSEARSRNPDNPDVGRLTMESALCTYKSWHKPNRRYPNVYADMMYNRIRKAEARFGPRFDLLWEARRQHLPERLRLEDCPYDPGLSPVKQNWYLETGEVIFMDEYEDMTSRFHTRLFPLRKDPTWTL